jgi:PKD repeat protein
VTHAYANATNYTVSLTATDVNGTETLTRNNYVHIYTFAVPSFTYGITLITNNLVTVNFTNTSVNANYCTWSFYNSSGIASANKLLGLAGLPGAVQTYTYTNAGTFPVVMSAGTPAGSVAATNSVVVP